MSNKKAAVYIVSGNRLVRESLARIFNRRNNLSAIPAEKVDLGYAKSVDKDCSMVVLLDSPGSVMQDRETIHELLKPPSVWKIIVLGMEEDPAVFIELIRMGTSGFLLRDASALDVVAAVRAVTCGEVVCPASLCKILFQHVAREMTGKPEVKEASGPSLTRRERQLVDLVTQGMTNKEIASSLHLAEQTVKNHVHNILRKTGARDRLEVSDVRRPDLELLSEGGDFRSAGTA
jgi:DNA-binding NarL/FixJ family response regulator